ncbi:MAG: hypothetical protein ACYDBY_08355 [Thermoanaerobaculia bacterium]
MNGVAETRRALCAYETGGLEGAAARGEGEAQIDDEGVSIAGLRVGFLDADTFTDERRVLTLGLHPAGTLRISMLARRHETFTKALGEARDAARVRGLLAHGLGVPESFEGALLEPGPAREARLLVWPTHVAVVPAGADPFQVPLGGVTDVRFTEGTWEVVLAAPGGPFHFGRLARRTDAFARSVRAARAAMLERCANASGSRLFADGRAVSAAALGRDFERLLEVWSAPERLEGALGIVKRAGRELSAIGLAELLDPDEEGLAAKVELPENTAAFLLAEVRGRIVLELLSGPSAATYVFRGSREEVGADLAALHFRRRGLALTHAEAGGAAGRPYRLALRRLEPMKRLRTATLARVVHDARWTEGLAKALDAT